MTRDHWTLLLLKGREAPRQFSVPARTAHFALGGATALIVLVGGMCATAGWNGVAWLQARHLQSENQLLTEELETLRGRVASLEVNLDTLATRDAEVRLLAGLDSIDGDVLEVGVGGPGLPAPESHPLWPVDSVLGATAFAVRYDVDVLERRARLLSESLAEASDSLVAHRELLESTPSILPAAGLLSSAFSPQRWHPIHHRPLPHEGVDIAAPQGTPILAAAKGRVIEAGWVSGYGQMVEIDHGFGYVTRYGHASELLVRKGQMVRRGDVIAQVGRTGIATASHLHYEVRVGGVPRNPMNYVLSSAVP